MRHSFTLEFIKYVHDIVVISAIILCRYFNPLIEGVSAGLACCTALISVERMASFVGARLI